MASISSGGLILEQGSLTRWPENEEGMNEEKERCCVGGSMRILENNSSSVLNILSRSLMFVLLDLSDDKLAWAV